MKRPTLAADAERPPQIVRRIRRSCLKYCARKNKNISTSQTLRPIIVTSTKKINSSFHVRCLAYQHSSPPSNEAIIYIQCAICQMKYALYKPLSHIQMVIILVINEKYHPCAKHIAPHMCDWLANSKYNLNQIIPWSARPLIYILIALCDSSSWCALPINYPSMQFIVYIVRCFGTFATHQHHWSNWCECGIS